uniref:DNA repair protein RecO n=1 Tax=Leptospirillum ferriphilum TaxID=178606 RepID=A0A7C3LVX2_9BACT
MEQRSLILRSVRYLESDRVVTFFSRDEGLITGFARGAAGMASRFGASLEPLTLSLIMGRHHLEGTLYRIHKAAILDTFVLLKSDLGRFYWAGASVRFLLGMLPPNLPEPLVFDLAVRYLESLADPEDSPALAWVRFATRSLALMGYQILSGTCSLCRETPWDDSFRYHPQDGRMLCSACHDSPEIRAESFVTVDRWTLEYLHEIGRNGGKVFLNRPLVEKGISFLDHVLAYRMDGWKSIDSLPVTFS